MFQITVLIKAAGQCAGQRHYVATSGRLPGAFSDGSSAVGSVEVVEAEPGKRVEIRAGFIGTTVIIRQVARYLTFAIRIPEEHMIGVSSRTQLCVQGCPANHQIVQEAENALDATKSINSLFRNDIPSTTLPITHSPKKAYVEDRETTLTDSSDFEASQFYSEEEARIKCRQILLDLPEPKAKKNSTKVVGNQKESVKSGKSSKSHSASLSSAAFSSLISSPIDEVPSGIKHTRMAAAMRPDSESAESSTKQNHRKQRRSHRRKGRQRRDIEESDTDNTKKLRCANQKEKMFESNFYFESCVFDLKTTGDIDFTLAAKAAMIDVKRTHLMGDDAPGTSLEVVRLWEPDFIRNCPDTEDKGSGNPGGKASHTTAHNLTIILCVLFSCVFINLATFLSCRFITVDSTKRKESKQLKYRQNNNLRTNVIACATS